MCSIEKRKQFSPPPKKVLDTISTTDDTSSTVVGYIINLTDSHKKSHQQ